MQALKALLKELVPSHRRLQDLVAVLLHNVIAAEGNLAFSEDSVKHVCELVLKDFCAERVDQGAPTQTLELLQDLGHCPGGRHLHDADQLLMNQAIEVMTLLSLRWFAMKNLVGMPDMSDYQRRSWLPPAFSSLVGQVIWRHRTAKSLQLHTTVVENLRWITFTPVTPGSGEDVMAGCNAMFRNFSGSDTARMKLGQFRKVVEILAMNPELRVRVRRCDPVRSCYGDAVSHTTSGLTRKQFKLMLMKTADLMGVHPLIIFQEMASQAVSLEAAQKAKGEAITVVPFVCGPAAS